MKYLDIYGKSIQFVYKGKPFYSTYCGLIISFIVFIIIFVFIILYLIDVFKYNQPTVINIPQSFTLPPYYLIYPNLIKNATSKYSFENNSSMGYQQIAFGIKENNEWKEINTKILNPIIKNLDNPLDSGIDLFWDKCSKSESFAHISKESYQGYELDKVYCIFSPFEIEGDITTENNIFKYFSFTLNLCQYRTYLKLNLKDLESYSYLEDYYNIDEVELNENKEIYFEMNFNNTDYSDSEYITCENNIEEKIKNYDFYFIYIDTIFNETSADKPLIRFLDWKKVELSGFFHSYMEIYYQINKIETFKSVLPKSLRKKNDSIYYLVEDNDKFTLASGYFNDEMKTILSIFIYSNDNNNRYERHYITLFDIIGKIGGFSLFIFMIGGIFATIGTSYSLKLSLMNDLYSINNPKYEKKINRSFDEYIKVLEENKFEYSKDKKLMKKEENFNNFFLKKNLDEPNTYKICKIIYSIYINHLYSGLDYSLFEYIFSSICCCFESETQKKKRKLYNLVEKEFSRDTDFLNLLECIQNFEVIKQSFLKKETQLSLFNALTNKSFSSVKEKENHENDESNKKILTKEEIDLNKLYDSFEKIFVNINNEQNKTKDEILFDNKLLEHVINKNKIKNLNKNTLNQLIEDEKTNEIKKDEKANETKKDEKANETKKDENTNEIKKDENID